MNAREIADKILDALDGRGGFDHWWRRIDEEIQIDIRDEIAQIIEEDLHALKVDS